MENIISARQYIIGVAAKFMIFVTFIVGFTSTAFAGTVSKATKAKHHTQRVVKSNIKKSKKKIAKILDNFETASAFSVNSVLEKDPDLAEFAGLIPTDKLSPDLFEPEAEREETGLSFIWPTNGFLISNYGPRDGRMHTGIDIKVAKGSEVVAAEDGEVVFAGRFSAYGIAVDIKHKDGYMTRYAHNSENLVKKGDIVRKGEVIALSGRTGRATCPHVHFEVHHNKKRLNPNNFVARDTFFVLNREVKSDKQN